MPDTTSIGEISFDIVVDASDYDAKIAAVQSNAAETANNIEQIFSGVSGNFAKSIKGIDTTFSRAAKAVKSAAKAAATDVKAVGTSGEQAAESLEQASENATETSEALEKVAENSTETTEALSETAEALEEVEDSASDTNDALDDTADALDTVQDNTKKTGGLFGKLKSKFSNVFKKSGEEADSLGEKVEDVGTSAGTAVSGVASFAKKAAGAIAGAFAVKKVVDFGKSCLDLGSDLAEVQNVVDTTFPSMSKSVDKFAQDSMSTFGLSETMAKSFTGTLGAMAKGLGFSESAAYDMSTTLTGLSGDVASFYNLSQEEAFSKLKGVFTGETEGLKSLGVVMTQSALDAYALANGFGKTTAQMSESEKVALRYQFVLSNLSAASGDFAKTSGGWSNQMKILHLQIDSIKASIGQGLIAAFTPAIKAVNALLGRLVTLASAFKSFANLITGNKGGGGDTGAAAMAALGDSGEMASSGLSDAADAADNAGKSSTKAGKAAKKAAKEIERSLFGFDKINKISAPTEDSDSGDAADVAGGSGIGAGALGSAVDFGSMAQGETVMDGMSKKFDGLIKRAKELYGLFKRGFKIGFGDSAKDIPRIQDGIARIKKSLQDIFTSPQVVNAADEWVNSCVLTMGTLVGSAASIGTSVATNLVLGVAGYLEQSGSYISDRIAGLFHIGVERNQIAADVALFLADVARVLTGDNAIACTTALIGIFSDGFLGVTQLAAQFAVDIEGLITRPFTENSAVIADAINNGLAPASVVLTTIWQSVKDTMEQAIAVYNSSVSPMIQGFTDTFSKLVKTFFDGYNTYMAPVLGRLAANFDVVWKEHVQPTLDKFIELIGAICRLIMQLWKAFIEPFLVWIAGHIWPVVAPIFEMIGNGFLNLLQIISDVAGVIIDVITSIVDALNSVSFDIPDWVPIWGGQSFGLDIPAPSGISVPRLANGGYVPRNSPQLAMIGDNRTQGEIVAPEGKLLELLKAAGGITKEDLESILNLNTMRIIAALAEVGFFVDGKELARAIRAGQNELKVQYNE